MYRTNAVCVIQGKIGPLTLVSILQLKLFRREFIVVIWRSDRSVWSFVVTYMTSTVNKYVIDDVDFPGIKNVNRQIVSTREGIRRAQKIFPECEYLYKLRSDQTFLITRSRINRLKFYAQDRLILLNYNSYVSRLYPFSDMFMMGRIEEMFKFWNIALDYKTLNDVEIERDLRYFQRQCTAEGYILSQFMKRINWAPKWDSQDSCLFMESEFIVFDYRYLGLIWWRKLFIRQRLLNDNLFIEGRRV